METMKPVAKEAKMNKAEAHQPHSGHARPAPPAGVGNEKKADMKGALQGQPTDGSHVGHTHLGHAVAELHEQHPIAYHEHGPHHGTDHHIRHEPMHGLRPSKG